MNCKQCGFEIKDPIHPEGFCCYGCQDVYREIKRLTFEKAASN